MDRGYVKLWRKTLDSGLLENGPAWQLFGYLLLNATHRPHKQIVRGAVFELAPGDVVFSLRTAAEKLKLGVQQVRTALALLDSLEIITRQPTHKATIISLINWDRYNAEQHTANTRDNTDLTHTQHTDGDASKNINKNERILNTPPLTPPQAGEGTDAPAPAQEEKPKRAKKPTSYPEDFEAFWRLYPKKVGKDGAFRSWKRRKADLPPIEQLAAILERQSHCEQWQCEGGRFIPLPATWLNQGRWQDESGENDSCAPSGPHKPQSWERELSEEERLKAQEARERIMAAWNARKSKAAP